MGLVSSYCRSWLASHKQCINYCHLNTDWELIKKTVEGGRKDIGLKGPHQHTCITTYWFGVMLRLDMEP